MISPGIDRDRITPEWLTKLTEPIEALYTALQHDLIVNIARQFNVFGRKANIPTSYAWRGYMLGQLGGLTKENYDTIARYSGDISEATRLAVQTSVEASVGVVDRAFMEEVLDPDYAPEITETTERVTGYYVNQALEKQNLVNTVMLNSTRRYYEQAVGATSDALDRSLDAAQQALNAAAGGVIHGTTDFYSALRDCVRDMADHGLTGFYDKAGREWSAQAYVTMDMRTTAANAAREAAMERNREYGNELIAVSSHPGARPLCEPYQGGVYSTDGSTGETTDVHGASIGYYPLELTSYGEAAGLFGINCGHYPSPFIPGLSVVRKLDISHEENERLYKESQRQRYMERRVRAAKIEADALKAAGDAEGAKTARAKARERNAELKAWCRERERAYYPEKVRVTRAESSPLTSPAPDATMKQDQGTTAIPNGIKGDYQDFKELSLTDAELSKLSQLHEQAMRTGYEYGSVVIDGVFSPDFTSSNANGVQVPGEYLSKSGITLLHAHTNDTVLSGPDFSFLLRDNVNNVAVKTRSGEVFNVRIGNGFRPTETEFKDALYWARTEAEKAVFAEARNNGWTESQTFYMVIREQARLLADYFEWDLEGGMP